MLGKRDPQLNLLDLGWRERIPQDHFAWQLERFCQEVEINEQMFAKLFADRGRPSVSPVITLRAILYQLEKGLSDREIEEGSAFDDRVKLALGLKRNDRPLDAVTLCDHRKRFLEHSVGWTVLEQTLRLAASKGLLKDDQDGGVHITDSFLVEGAAATQDTITLIRKAVRQVLRFAQALGWRDELAQVLRRSDYDCDAKPKIDWANAEAKRQLVEELVHDGRALVQAARQRTEPQGAGAPWRTFQAAVDLLDRVVEQDIEEDDQGRIRIRQGVAKDRVISVTDPEMRHGRKTTAKKTDGYKTNLIVAGDQGSLITHVTVRPSNATDAEMAKAGVESQKAAGRPVNKLLGDTAYGGADLRVDLAAEGVEVIAKVPPATNRGGRLSKEDFEINLQERSVRCPQGQVTTETRIGKDAQGRPIPIFQFAAEQCAACPLRAVCTTSAAGRSVSLHYHEDVLQAARAFQQTDEFAAIYPTRSHVERTIADVVHHGGRHARYIGLFKTTFQMVMTAARHNIKQIHRLLAEKMSLAASIAATGEV